MSQLSLSLNYLLIVMTKIKFHYRYSLELKKMIELINIYKGNIKKSPKYPMAFRRIKRL